ncbi:alpha-amylase family glycosyl hydrolase [Limibacter armeniacum]|uniref:DUF4961 domain-containing protein n=1 Tax=Limibacter armeniacum TaxID=466084 RepID=UPI002FE55A59
MILKQLRILLFLLGVSITAFAQTPKVSLEPANATVLDEVTITFDVSGTNVEGLSDIYIWGWSNVGDWQTNGGSWTTSMLNGAKLAPVEGQSNKYTFKLPLTFTDRNNTEKTANNLAELIGVAPNQIESVGYLLRSDDGNTKTGDASITFSELSLTLDVSVAPAKEVYSIGESVNITATASSAADLSIWVNGSEVKAATAVSELSYSYTATVSGSVDVVVKANSDEVSLEETVSFYVKPEVVLAPRPEGLHLGANYNESNPTKVTLVLQDPAKEKEFVNVIGEFSDWVSSETYLMKKSEEADANYFWLEMTVEAGKEYIYQYLIDGSLKIADPYTEKVSDFDDKYIEETRYPNLIAYPENSTSYRASVFQTNQPEYVWSITDFQRPAKESLVVYEMHVRDFTEESTYEAATDRLDYIKELGANCIHLMPVNEFEGNDSWGYNPNFYFAPDKYYGTKDDLKAFIDAAHGKGIAVVIDMVLNHSYNSAPLVRMYNEGDYGKPTAANPWFNVDSPNPTYSWGADFNHESLYTQAFIDSVNTFWLEEYNIDGYRFDFTKGFTQTPGEGHGRDDSRIAILTRMAGEIWNNAGQEDAYVIFEHLADNSEEQVLAAEGILLWGNINHDFRTNAKGGNANLDWQYHGTRGMTQHGVLSYMESHDEERMLYDALNFGKQTSEYDLQDKQTAIQRMKLNTAFFLPIPGPKMIWQFGELGYDVSINQTALGGEVNDGNRTSRKPVLWSYTEDADRASLYKVYQALISLRNEKELYSLSGSDVSLSIGADKVVKEYSLTNGSFTVKVIGNFGVTAEKVAYDYSADGSTWYSYFENGKEVPASSTMLMAPGAFMVLVNEAVTYPETGLVAVGGEQMTVTPAEFTPSTEITVIFDPTVGGAELAEAAEVYMVASLVMDGADSETLANTVDNNTKGKMTKTADGLWEITLTPATYFGLSAEDQPFRLAIQFRNADSSVSVTAAEGKPFFKDFQQFSGDLFVVGSMTEGGWDPFKAEKMENQGDGIYTITLELTGSASEGFKFITAADDWANVTQYGSKDSQVLVEANYEGDDIKLPSGLTAGTYEVTANLSAKTVAFEREDQVTGIEDNLGVGSFKVAPNPFSDWLVVTAEAVQGTVNVVLTDMSGKVITTYEVQATQPVELNTSQLRSGMYLMQIFSEKGREVKKLIKH